MTDPDRQILDEQIAYYRARAAEYDATSTPVGDPFAAHAGTIRASLRGHGRWGRVLEIAAGTGQWTGLLADVADDLLVTDASAEMLAIAQAKLGERPAVRYRVADAFALQAPGAFDTVFFGFFLSHVPMDRFAAFWGLLERLLAPGGRVCFVDEGLHDAWSETWIDEQRGIVRRTLVDGSLHRAIKVLWRPEELAARLAPLGWEASVQAEGPFYWGTASHR